MKPNHLFTSLLAVTALFVASCSTPRMAQNAVQDDVYNTTAQAKEYKPSAPVQNAQVDNSSNEDYYGKTDPYYDMDYSSRIDRFYYGNPYRGYYDPFYNYYGYNSYYSPYGYNNIYLPSTFGYSIGFSYNFYNNWYNPYYGYGYGYPYNNYWGVYSANPYGGGYYGNGYYGGGYYAGSNTNNPNYGARPRRGSENGVGANGAYTGRGSSIGAPSRSNNGNNNGNTVSRSRAEMYNPANNGSVSRPNTTSERPSRGNDSRPTRTSEAPSRPQPSYNPPPQQSSPPPSSGGSRSEGSSGGSTGGGRPTRGGGR